MKVNSMEFEKFTVFDKLKLDFSPNINIIMGLNGVGKTVLLKSLYSILKTIENVNIEMMGPMKNKMSNDKIKDMLTEKLIGVFMPDEGEIERLVKKDSVSKLANVKLESDEFKVMSFNIEKNKDISISKGFININDNFQVIFIPPKEIISASANFFTIYENYHIAFEETYYDLNKLLLKPLKKGRKTKEQSEVFKKLENIIKGKVRVRDNKFYVVNDGIYPSDNLYPSNNLIPSNTKEIEMGLVAEGHRKLATILHLINNGTIDYNTILIWDEPETNLNPKMMNHIKMILAELAKMGVQIFVSTHSYFFLQEFSLYAQYESNKNNMDINFISLYESKSENIIKSESVSQSYDLDNNSIIEEFENLYNKEQEKFYED